MSSLPCGTSSKTSCTQRLKRTWCLHPAIVWSKKPFLIPGFFFRNFFVFILFCFFIVGCMTSNGPWWVVVCDFASVLNSYRARKYSKCLAEFTKHTISSDISSRPWGTMRKKNPKSCRVENKDILETNPCMYRTYFLRRETGRKGGIWVTKRQKQWISFDFVVTESSVVKTCSVGQHNLIVWVSEQQIAWFVVLSCTLVIMTPWKPQQHQQRNVPNRHTMKSGTTVRNKVLMDSWRRLMLR